MSDSASLSQNEEEIQVNDTEQREAVNDGEIEINANEEDQEENKSPTKPENYRLGGRKPLPTILSLMGGPVLLQICGAAYGIVSTMWVSKAVGTVGVTAISLYSSFDTIGRAFGFFLSISASTKVSQLFGLGCAEEAGQVVCDLLRMCVVCGAFVPAVLLPLVNMCCRWFGADDEVVDLGFSYLCPILSCSVFTCVYLLCNGLLQGEGRTFLVGIVSVISLCTSMFVIETLFLFAFKSGIQGAGWATVLGDAIPGIAITICYFRGKFTLKPDWHGLFRKFSPHTFKALRVGISQLVSNLSTSIPGIIIRKLIGNASPPDEFNSVLAGYNVIFRYAMVTCCVVIAVNMGYIPSASYSYAAKRYKRFLRLTFHAMWISQLWCLLTNIFTWAIPREISKIFGSDPEYLKWAEKMLLVGNMLGIINYFRFICQGFLQALQMGGYAMIITFTTQLVALLVFAFIFYYTDKHDPVRICWCYPLCYASGVVMGVCMMIKPIIKIRKLQKESEANTEKSLDEAQTSDKFEEIYSYSSNDA